jgi:hypothetical protein
LIAIGFRVQVAAFNFPRRDDPWLFPFMTLACPP